MRPKLLVKLIGFVEEGGFSVFTELTNVLLIFVQWVAYRSGHNLLHCNQSNDCLRVSQRHLTSLAPTVWGLI